ncbi:MAG: single-stranded DNA-binding protein [Mycoplasmataceae bacterium]|nr:single-stranded DNA-binding protein [Mycoplasmataceae bacterium]
MNKVIVIGRLVRNPETQSTNSGIKYSRITVAVNRQFVENQTDFIPIVTWRNQADFVDKYLNKGALISVEGRFTSSSYQDSNGQNITRYEVTADRVESLETRAQAALRNEQAQQINVIKSATSTQVIEFEKENKPAPKEQKKEIPWELDL